MAWVRSIGLTGAIAVAFSLIALEAPAPAGTSHASVRVSYVLAPTWLPSGYSATGGGWVTPAGGLHVYPDAQVSASRVSTGSWTSTNIPVLFTLDYYGYHNPESKSIRVTATPKDPTTPPGKTVALGHRHVMLTSFTQGALHNIVTDASWTENGDQVVLTVDGLTTAQVSRFITGLAERKPPHA